MSISNTVPRLLDPKDYNEIPITWEGNYRFLSMYLEHHENNYNYYRQIVYNYIKSNKNLLRKLFYYLEEEFEEEYEIRYTK